VLGCVRSGEEIDPPRAKDSAVRQKRGVKGKVVTEFRGRAELGGKSGRKLF